jgi:hypothetical protein
MSRRLGDERARYGRKSPRERLEDILAWPDQHRVAALVLLIIVVGALLLVATRGAIVRSEDLAVGDCLFVRTDTGQEGVRPIGDDTAVVRTLLDGRVEKASCTASHGHEVSAVVDVEPLRDPRTEAEDLCRQAFEPYVGRPELGSVYGTFAAVPTPQAQAAGASLAFCLVARADGGWMDHPARNSRE